MKGVLRHVARFALALLGMFIGTIAGAQVDGLWVILLGKVFYPNARVVGDIPMLARSPGLLLMLALMVVGAVSVWRIIKSPPKLHEIGTRQETP